MDKRLKQAEEKKEDAALVEVGEDKYIIKVDKVSSDNAYKESIIYNLVQKLSHLDEMKRGYNDALEKIETYPTWIKYYVHLQYLVPVTCLILGYMKYKKVLSMNTGFAVICGATIGNEFAKTIKMKKLGGEKARKYEEHDANYSNLMSVFVKDVSFSQVCKYVLGVKITRELVDWRKYSARDDLTNDYIQSTYY